MVLVIDQRCVVRLHGTRKAQVAQGVFMGAAHARVARQGCELVERVQHLCGRAFEQAAAAARKQSVTTKQQGRAFKRVAEKRDVPRGVPGHVHHRKVQTQGLDPVARRHTLRRLRNVFTRWTHHMSLRALTQNIDTTHMVSVVVGD